MKFKKGQDLVCIHYKDLPPVTVDSIRGKEVWVIDGDTGKLWWGPESWFKAISIPKKKRKTKRNRVVKHSGFLCEDNIVGCTCNQASSVGQQ